MTHDGIRDLTMADLDWVLDIGQQRRARITPHAPRFWNPAPNAREVHATFLGNKINDPTVLTIRTDHGFLFGFPGKGRLEVDDMVLDDERRWPIDGIAMLYRAGVTGPLNFVCPVPEPERREAAETVGLTRAESWWTKNLNPASDPTPLAADPQITVDGAAGLLLPAPPIYAPGGPVLLATELTGRAGLDNLEQAAAASGAPVAVASQAGADPARAELLEAGGYVRTSDFYRGETRHRHAE